MRFCRQCFFFYLPTSNRKKGFHHLHLFLLHLRGYVGFRGASFWNVFIEMGTWLHPLTLRRNFFTFKAFLVLTCPCTQISGKQQAPIMSCEVKVFKSERKLLNSLHPWHTNFKCERRSFSSFVMISSSSNIVLLPFGPPRTDVEVKSSDH